MVAATQNRSKWQAQAARRYPKFVYIGGDGLHECWVVLTKCPHEQTTCWRYCLRPSKDEAELLLARWSIEGCGYQCKGAADHTLWKLA